MDKENGVWRTIRGRRIFIASGESLGQAMAKSGKFKREDIRQARASVSQIDNYNRTVKKSVKARQEAIKKMKNKEYRFEGNISSKNQAEKNRPKSIKNYEDKLLVDDRGKTRLERYKYNYSDTDVRELRHEKLQKKLADYRKKKGIKTSITSEEYNKRMNDTYNDLKAGKISQEEYSKTTDDIMDNYTTPRMNKEQVEKSNKKAIADYKAKKQSNIRDYKQEQKDLLEDMSKLSEEQLKEYRDIFKEQGKNKFAERIDKHLESRKQSNNKQDWRKSTNPKDWDDSAFAPKPEDWDDINHWYNDDPREEWEIKRLQRVADARYEELNKRKKKDK